MADKDQCHMEAVEPRTIWIMPMGYMVDATTLDACAQHMLSQPIDDKEERFGTCQDKDLDLHKKFTRPTGKRKVRKEVEELEEQMGITKEVVQRAREQNILKEEDVVKKQAKQVSPPPKQDKAKQSKFAPISDVQKPIPPPKPQSSSTGEDEKKNKEKSVRKYVIVEEETKSDEEVREVKKLSTYARVVKKPLSNEAPPAKKAKTQGEPSSKMKADKKKSEIDEALKLSKLEDPYTIVPPLQKIIDTIVK
ncbi:uncharacterized protein LOC131858776 [Cryptomeria japonica]|uniref:uncharacterized protein LOC131858776 n=1 Tax=Cryptomeria japonica TaxID=3369 RepID=UPI0027D9EAD9|nr:uncharacterized protein LOC131858776 [Cryptomeria japonica]